MGSPNSLLISPSAQSAFGRSHHDVEIVSRIGMIGVISNVHNTSDGVERVRLCVLRSIWVVDDPITVQYHQPHRTPDNVGSSAATSFTMGQLVL